MGYAHPPSTSADTYTSPRSDPETKAWTKLDNGNSKRRYDIAGVRLLRAAVLSLGLQPNQYRLELSEQQRRRATELRDQLQRPHSEQARSGPIFVHRLLWELFSDNLAVTYENKFLCPVFRYLALYALNADGTLKQAHELTQILAILRYLIRGCVLYEAFTKKSQEDDIHAFPTCVSTPTPSYVNPH